MITCQFPCWVTSCNESWFVFCQFHFPWIQRENGCYEPTFSLAEQRTLLIKALLCFLTCKNQHPHASTGFCIKDTSMWLTTNIAFGLVPTFQLHQGINLQSRNSPVKLVKTHLPTLSTPSPRLQRTHLFLRARIFLDPSSPWPNEVGIMEMLLDGQTLHNHLIVLVNGKLNHYA